MHKDVQVPRSTWMCENGLPLRHIHSSPPRLVCLPDRENYSANLIFVISADIEPSCHSVGTAPAFIDISLFHLPDVILFQENLISLVGFFMTRTG